LSRSTEKLSLKECRGEGLHLEGLRSTIRGGLQGSVALVAASKEKTKSIALRSKETELTTEVPWANSFRWHHKFPDIAENKAISLTFPAWRINWKIF
jgi:hypothetical protein